MSPPPDQAPAPGAAQAPAPLGTDAGPAVPGPGAPAAAAPAGSPSDVDGAGPAVAPAAVPTPRRRSALDWPLAAAVVAFLVAGYTNFGIHHWDEHYQVLEFAGFKLGLLRSDQLAWEYGARIRPWLQPAVFAVWLVPFKWLWQGNPVWIAALGQWLSGLVAVFALDRFLRRGFPDTGRLERLLVLTFFSTVYFGVRTSSENLSTSLLLLGVSELLVSPPVAPGFLVGLLWGLAFEVRFQAAICVVGLGLWGLWEHGRTWLRAWRRILLGAGGGFATALVIGLLADRWGYGAWVFPATEYFRVNLLQGKANEFGTAPFLGYVPMLYEFLGPVLATVGLGASLWFFIVHRRHPATWMLVPYVLVHCWISHKELRFLAPWIVLMPAFFAVLCHDLAARLRGRPRVAARIARAAGAAALAVILLVGAWDWAVVVGQPTEPKFKLIRALHAEGATSFPCAYTGIETFSHGPLPLNLYHLGGDRTAMHPAEYLRRVRAHAPHASCYAFYFPLGPGGPDPLLSEFDGLCTLRYRDAAPERYAAVHARLPLNGALRGLWYGTRVYACP